MRTLGRAVGAGPGGEALGVGDEAAGIEVGDVESRIVKALRDLGIRLVGGLGEGCRADEKNK